ncbi:hypothetical protein BN2476_740092 [Paraburkholderia piptadeniae]|uniref:Uncharacterized protein n=1 Tax=Paraburkholderia piptadeniae TaxID=1701573 RepID=A0A1N7SRH3_9BURK|nr:hypothetical protein [Paraburkholderia piptadeniae]SIT50048.1 hypothetical protein BN2476_740092 [Paraburkholderia piptadeniae]
MKLFRICNTTSGHLFGDYEARDEHHALDVLSLESCGQTHAEYVAQCQAELDAEGSGREYKCDLHVAEVDDRDYENLFIDIDGGKYNHVFGFRLARFVRAWYPTATSAENCSLEDMLKRGGDGYDAIDFLLHLLGQARNEWVSENDREPSFEQCCDELASWGLHYDCHYGVRVIVWESGMREVRWGYGDKYCWTDLDEVLKSVTLKTGDAPDWWDEDWTDYEYWDFRGQLFLKREDLPVDDPRSHDCEEEEEEAET